MRFGFAAIVLVLLAAPLLAVLPISVTSGTVLSLHLPGVSLRWYGEFFESSRWMLAACNSFIIGCSTSVLATALGFMAAWGMWRAAPSRLLSGVLNLPLVVPSVITGLAMYFAAAAAGLTGGYTGIVLAHTVLAIPYVVLTLLAALRRFDAGLLRAAASLGADWRVSLRRVVVPSLGPAVAAAMLFAFAISFDELIVALFLAGPGQYTLPRQMLAGISDILTPTICAAAVVVSLVSVLAMGLASALLRKAG